MATKTQKVTVIVPERPGYPGIWSAGRHWASGEHADVEVTADELQSLASRQGIIVQQGGKTIRMQSAGGATTPANLTADELQVLEQYRADRHAKALADQQQTEPSFSKTKESTEDAVARAARETAPSPGAHADAPAEHREVLLGDKPAGVQPKKR